MAFPIGPFTTGQVHIEGGVSYTYNGFTWAKTPVAPPADNYINGASFDVATRLLTLAQAVGSTPNVTVTVPDVKVSALAFDNATRVVTLTQNDASTFTATIPETSTTLAYDAATKVLTYTGETGIAQTVDLSALAVDIFVDGATYDTTTAVLTLTDSDGATPDVVVDLSALKSALVDNGDGTYTHTVDGVSVTIDTRLSKAAVPATGYEGQIIEYGSVLYKWTSPGLWFQILP